MFKLKSAFIQGRIENHPDAGRLILSVFEVDVIQNNRAFLVISAVPGWYAVQATDSTPGSAFIRAKDIALDNSGRYVVTWDTDLYDDNTMAKSGVVKRFTVGSLIGISGEFSRMVFNEGKDNEFRAWVKSQFVAPVIN